MRQRATLNGKIQQRAVSELQALIDAYGDVVTQRKELEAKEAELKQRLGELTGNEAGKYDGVAYSLQIAETTTTEYDVEKVYKALKRDDFLKVVKITSRVKDYIPPAKIGEVSVTVAGSPKYTVRKNK